MQVLVEDSERDSGERERGDRKKEEEEEKVGRERRVGGEENRYYEKETESQMLLRSLSQTTARLSGMPILRFHEILLIPVTVCLHSYKLVQFPF